MNIIVAGAMPSRDANGRALAGKLKFYLPGTTTPAVVYTDMALSVPHLWPVTSDDAGRYTPIWADNETYFDVVWTDLATDSNIAAYADVRALDNALSASADIATDAAAAAVAAAAEAAATLVEIETTIADLGDFSDAVAAAEAAAVSADADAAAAAASAVASAASASSIDQNIIFGRAVAAASLL
jgi:hypothetical protein